MNNKISNPKMEVPKGIDLNDKDFIMSILTCLKEIEKNYTIALEESSCETLFNKHKEVFEKIVALQRKTYETLFRLGLYELERVENNKIVTKYNTLQQEYNLLK